MFKFPARRLAFVALLLFFAVSLAATSRAAITYTLVPATLSGYVINGSITTDGATGNLSASDILGWSVTVTGSANLTFSGSTESSWPSAGLTATSSSLSLAFPATPSSTYTSRTLAFGSTPPWLSFTTTAFSATYYYFYSDPWYQSGQKLQVSSSFSTSQIYNNWSSSSPSPYVIAGVSTPASPTWTGTAAGSWTSGTNWSSGSPPNGAGQQAIVGAATTAPLTITLDSPQTLGTLTFANTASNSVGYTLASGSAGSLTMDNAGSAAQISVTGGSQAISAVVSLAGSLSITPSSSTTLDISGNIRQNSGGQGSLTLNGPGVLILSGTNSYTSGTTIDAGTLFMVKSSAIADGTRLTVGKGGVFVFNPTVQGGPLILSSAAPSTPLAGEVPAVPEPSTFVLLAAGALGLLGSAWRRRRSRSTDRIG